MTSSWYDYYGGALTLVVTTAITITASFNLELILHCDFEHYNDVIRMPWRFQSPNCLSNMATTNTLKRRRLGPPWKKFMGILRIIRTYPLQWRHNGRDNVSNYQPRVCLLSCVIRRRSKKTSKLRVTGLWVGEFTRDRWIPRTKGQLCGKCFHLMTSSCADRLTHPTKSQ